MTTSSSATGSVDLNWKARTFVAVCFVASTFSASLITNWTSQRFAVHQQESAAARDNVQRFEGAYQKLDGLIRVYMMGVNEGHPSPEAKAAVLDAAQDAWQITNTLEATLQPAGKASASAYQMRLQELSRNLRKSDGLLNTASFAQSVSSSIDERKLVANALRQKAALPLLP